MKVKFVVQILLDIDWKKLNQSKPEGISFINTDWVKRRISLFKELTLRSLNNQSFKDFEIWLLCSETYRKITESYELLGVKKLYDLGRNEISKLDCDYISISRVDSDDLYHKDTMQEIKSNLILSDRMECLIFRDMVVWDRIFNHLRRKHRISPPTYTQIIPRKIYEDWDAYKKCYFVGHEIPGRWRKTRKLSPYKICDVSHHDAHSFRRFNVIPEKYLSKNVLKDKRHEAGYIDDPDKIFDILKHFGVPRNYIKGGERKCVAVK